MEYNAYDMVFGEEGLMRTQGVHNEKKQTKKTAGTSVSALYLDYNEWARNVRMMDVEKIFEKTLGCSFEYAPLENLWCLQTRGKPQKLSSSASSLSFPDNFIKHFICLQEVWSGLQGGSAKVIEVGLWKSSIDGSMFISARAK